MLSFFSAGLAPPPGQPATLESLLTDRLSPAVHQEERGYFSKIVYTQRDIFQHVYAKMVTVFASKGLIRGD